MRSLKGWLRAHYRILLRTWEKGANCGGKRRRIPLYVGLFQSSDGHFALRQVPFFPMIQLVLGCRLFAAATSGRLAAHSPLHCFFHIHVFSPFTIFPHCNTNNPKCSGRETVQLWLNMSNQICHEEVPFTTPSGPTVRQGLSANLCWNVRFEERRHLSLR